MLKKFLIVSFIFLFTFVNNAFAHTHIESSSPQSGEVITEELNEIQLTFEGKIEQNSSFTLQNTAGESISIDHISATNTILTGTLSTPLENEEYVINWTIIGADGHVMEGEVPFKMDLPTGQTNENTEDGAVDVEVIDADLSIATSESESAAEVDLAESEPVEKKSYLAPSLIGVLILIVIGSFIFIAKRKQ
ncbi:copper resistance protein CopC [Ureibacillus chungkukjangi]|uniref:copper resistance CopC family protein n=1 Tax=Ureibacillus chungkukjangi TaxID=1202712 RepID=UPI002040562B|nr:copper resistance protein CopC [Ureibacillus chungkukjangi]